MAEKPFQLTFTCQRCGTTELVEIEADPSKLELTSGNDPLDSFDPNGRDADTQLGGYLAFMLPKNWGFFKNAGEKFIVCEHCVHEIVVMLAKSKLKLGLNGEIGPDDGRPSHSGRPYVKRILPEPRRALSALTVPGSKPPPYTEASGDVMDKLDQAGVDYLAWLDNGRDANGRVQKDDPF